MLFAAGLGTRLQNETAQKPKALVDVGGKPLLQHAIEKLKASGIAHIVINVHHFADLVIDFVNSTDWGIPISISHEKTKLLETGGGLRKAAHLFHNNSPIIVYNVDILSNLDLQVLHAQHAQNKALASLVVRNRETQRYFKFDAEKNLVGWINKQTGESKISKAEEFHKAREMAFSGIHIIQPELLNLLPNEERFSIVKVYLELAKTKAIKGFFDDSELWMDVGKPAQLEEARQMFK